jgi:hypothetical protein
MVKSGFLKIVGDAAGRVEILGLGGGKRATLQNGGCGAWFTVPRWSPYPIPQELTVQYLMARQAAVQKNSAAIMR